MSIQLALVVQGDVTNLSANQIHHYQQLLQQLGLGEQLSIIHINNKPVEPQYPYEVYAPLEEGIPDSMFLSEQGLCKAMSNCPTTQALMQLYTDNKKRIEASATLMGVLLTQNQLLHSKVAA